jgi:uncharacterized membrane-anchored protein YjiN (DUF445 family)
VQVLCFIIGIAGAAVLLDYSTYDSQIQPLIRERMRFLISESQNEYASSILRMVQETVRTNTKPAYPARVTFHNLGLMETSSKSSSFIDVMGGLSYMMKLPPFLSTLP